MTTASLRHRRDGGGDDILSFDVNEAEAMKARATVESNGRNTNLSAMSYEQSFGHFSPVGSSAGAATGPSLRA